MLIRESVDPGRMPVAITMDWDGNLIKFYVDYPKSRREGFIYTLVGDEHEVLLLQRGEGWIEIAEGAYSYRIWKPIFEEIRFIYMLEKEILNEEDV